LLAALSDNPQSDLMFELTQAGVFVELDDLIAHSSV
jgi:hypothetical protein